jgi:hypothetical protein
LEADSAKDHAADLSRTAAETEARRREIADYDAEDFHSTGQPDGAEHHRLDRDDTLSDDSPLAGGSEMAAASTEDSFISVRSGSIRLPSTQGSEPDLDEEQLAAIKAVDETDKQKEVDRVAADLKIARKLHEEEHKALLTKQKETQAVSAKKPVNRRLELEEDEYEPSISHMAPCMGPGSKTTTGRTAPAVRGLEPEHAPGPVRKASKSPFKDAPSPAKENRVEHSRYELDTPGSCRRCSKTYSGTDAALHGGMCPHCQFPLHPDVWTTHPGPSPKSNVYRGLGAYRSPSDAKGNLYGRPAGKRTSTTLEEQLEAIFRRIDIELPISFQQLDQTVKAHISQADETIIAPLIMELREALLKRGVDREDHIRTALRTAYALQTERVEVAEASYDKRQRKPKTENARHQQGSSARKRSHSNNLAEALARILQQSSSSKEGARMPTDAILRTSGTTTRQRGPQPRCNQLPRRIKNERNANHLRKKSRPAEEEKHQAPLHPREMEEMTKTVTKEIGTRRKRARGRRRMRESSAQPERRGVSEEEKDVDNRMTTTMTTVAATTEMTVRMEACR